MCSFQAFCVRSRDILLDDTEKRAFKEWTETETCRWMG